MLVAQKAAAKDEPAAEDMYEIGSVATILQMLKLPDGTVKVLVEGAQRARIEQHQRRGDAFRRRRDADRRPSRRRRAEVEALRRALRRAVRPVRQAQQEDPAGDPDLARRHRRAGRLADTIAAHLPLKLEQKQAVLETCSTSSKRLEHLLEQLEGEIDILQVEKRIRGRVKRQMEKSQREYYLNEQVKAIQKELGEGEEGADLEELEKKIKAAQDAEGSAQEGRGRAQEAQADVADVGRSHRRAQLHRHAGRPAVEKKTKIKQRPGQRREGARTTTTTAWRRSRNASSSTSRCSSASTR